MTQAIRTTFIAAIAGLGAFGAHAAAPEKAICAVEQAIACPAHENCQRSLPGAMNLPVLMKIDRPAGMVISRLESGEQRSSAIGTETGDDAVHTLQGVDGGAAWSMRIDLADGRFTLVSALKATGYVAFGSCSSALLD